MLTFWFPFGDEGLALGVGIALISDINNYVN